MVVILMSKNNEFEVPRNQNHPFLILENLFQDPNFMFWGPNQSPSLDYLQPNNWRSNSPLQVPWVVRFIHDSNTYESDDIDKGPGGSDPDPDPDHPSDKWAYLYTTYYYFGVAINSPNGSILFPTYRFSDDGFVGTGVNGDEAYLRSRTIIVFDSSGVVNTGIFAWNLDSYVTWLTSGKYYFEDVFHNLTYTSFFEIPGKQTNLHPNYPEDYPTW